MCGIGGVIMFEKRRSAKELSYIRCLVERIAVENQARGRDATGFTAFSKGRQLTFKHAIEANKLVDTNAFITFANRNINNGTKVVLVHTRMGTKGSELNNLNNHPIESLNFTGVHNGMIYNDDALFAKHKMARAAEVDSEVIFRLLDLAGESPTSESLTWVAEQLTGSFTTAFVGRKDQSKMYLIKNDNPVTLVYIPSLNIIVFASMERYIMDAIQHANIRSAVGGEKDSIVATDSLTILTPRQQTIYTFDTNSNNPIEQMEQIPVAFRENHEGWGHYYAFGYQEDDNFFRGGTEDVPAEDIKEELLLSIRGFLSEGQIAMLEESLEAIATASWMEGWSRGRSSLSEEIDQKCEISYESGYDEGFNDGFQDGSDIAVESTVEV